MSVSPTEPPPTYTRSPLRLLVGLVAVFAVILVVGSYTLGYSNGRHDETIAELHKADCRAELAGPVNDARDRGQAAYNEALPAIVSGDDPVIAAELRRLTGEADPTITARRAVLELLRANADFRKALTMRGPDVAGQCEDGHPG